jgi:hypothetical protein
MTRGNFMSDKKSRTRRQEFLYRNEEMKILHMAKLKKAELTITEFFNQRVDEYLQTEEYPGVDYSGMKIKMNELEKENEQLRATVLIKSGALKQTKGELRTIRAETIGSLNPQESLNLSIQIESAIKEAGSITRRDLLSLIEEPEKIKGILGLLSQVELRLVQQSKIVITNGGELHWIGTNLN